MVLKYSSKIFIFFCSIDIVLRNEFIQGCLRDELLRQILAPNTAISTEDEPTTLIETDANI